MLLLLRNKRQARHSVWILRSEKGKSTFLFMTQQMEQFLPSAAAAKRGAVLSSSSVGFITIILLFLLMLYTGVVFGVIVVITFNSLQVQYCINPNFSQN
jgi:hypothetical protein